MGRGERRAIVEKANKQGKGREGKGMKGEREREKRKE